MFAIICSHVWNNTKARNMKGHGMKAHNMRAQSAQHEGDAAWRRTS